MVELKATFGGSIPDYYDRYLGPALFDAFAADLAQRASPKPRGDVLEIACGTGLVTRRLRDRLDPSVRLVATDLSSAMLEYARGRHGANGIEWREADAARLPFGDREFGAIVCALGFMFVPDKRAAFREAWRVLADGGTLLFNVWDRIEENVHNLAFASVMERLFPGDAEMRFTLPYEMYDRAALQRLLDESGFVASSIETARLPVDRVSARTIAIGQVHGTPRSLLIAKRGASLDDVVESVTAALTAIGGADPYRGWAQAIVVEARAKR
jgi:SAM-dependent methyltransferase